MTNESETYVENYSFLSLNKRPRLLNILLLLSTIFILSTLTTVTQKLIDGPMTEIQLQENMTSLYGTTASLKASGMDSQNIQAVQLIKKNSIYVNNESFYLTYQLMVVTSIIGLVAIFFMFIMKKVGFYIYIFYSIMSIASIYITTPPNLILNISIVLLVVPALIFIVLYGISMRKSVKSIEELSYS